MDYPQMLDKIKNKIPFSMSRWGDGEWNWVFNVPIGQYQADRHLYYPEIGVRLRDILKSNPKYYLGLQNLGYKLNKARIDEFTNGLELQWIDHDILHKRSMDGTISEFFDVLKTANTILVGPDRLRGMDKYIEYNEFIEVPLINCWLQHDRIEKDIRALLTDREYTIVLICASSTANILVDNLYKEFGDKHSLVDIGSVFEPYVGVANRVYHKDILEKLQQGQK